MQVEQKELLLTHWSKLVHITEIRSLASHLVDKNIFTQVEISNIFTGDDELGCKERFFNEFLNKEMVAFEHLILWLNSTGFNKLARKLATQKPGITPFKESDDDDKAEDDDDEFVSSIEADISASFDDSIEPLEINVDLADQFYDTPEHNPNMPYYKSRSKKRGRVLIINNDDFSGTQHRTRRGADIDEMNLKKLFEQMGGWVIKSYTNKTAEEMRAALRTFTKAKTEKRSDICFVIIMSHGSEKLNETIIFGSDGHYLRTSEIQNYFSHDNCPLFRGKPKIFVYQVCRGHELDIPQVYTEFDGKCKVSHQRSKSDQSMCGHFRPIEDVLIGYATMQGSRAHRDPFRGTWYIELFCKHFMELAKCEPVDNILLKVDDGLRRRKSEIGTVQTAELIFKGFKKLYLNPGLYEDNGKKEKYETKQHQDSDA